MEREKQGYENHAERATPHTGKSSQYLGKTIVRLVDERETTTGGHIELINRLELLARRHVRRLIPIGKPFMGNAIMPFSVEPKAAGRDPHGEAKLNELCNLDHRARPKSHSMKIGP